MSQKYRVEEAAILLDALTTLFPDSSKRTLSQWIAHGRIVVDGVVQTHTRLPLAPTQEITLLPKENKKLGGGMRLIWEDRWLIVIDKPSHLLSVPSDDPNESSALALLCQQFGPLFAVHRLDREASGLLLFARNKVVEKRLEKLFESKTIHRNYFAVVEGRLKTKQGRFESYLLEKENYDVIPCSENEGKLAITDYEVLYRSSAFSYLLLKLHTGRKHQIRVHTSSSGHPIVGDSRYLALTNPIHRLALHAFRLKFIHPFTHKNLSFFAPLPSSFNKIVPPHLTSQLKNI